MLIMLLGTYGFCININSKNFLSLASRITAFLLSLEEASRRRRFIKWFAIWKSSISFILNQLDSAAEQKIDSNYFRNVIERLFNFLLIYIVVKKLYTTLYCVFHRVLSSLIAVSVRSSSKTVLAFNRLHF